MNITVSGKNVDLGTSFRQHAEDTIASVVQKYFARAVAASVILTNEAGGFLVKVHVVLTRRMDMEASGTAADPRLALDEAVDHIEKRLRRYKRRLKNHQTDAERVAEEQARNQAGAVAAMTVLSPAVEQDSDGAEGQGQSQGQGQGQNSANAGDSAAPVILAEMDYDIHELTLEEAVMQFDLSGQSALMFRNKSHLGLNMLYRRVDGSIGWVDPRGNRQS